MGEKGAPRGSELQRSRGLFGPAVGLIAALVLAGCPAPQRSQPPSNARAPAPEPAPAPAPAPATAPEAADAETPPEPDPLAAPENVAAPPADARDLGRGLRVVVLASGSGKTHPKPADEVTVHYTGWTTDGEMFDSSHQRGRPATFRPDRVIEGWRIALAKMRVGDRWRVWIPEALAYKGRKGPPEGMLVFDIEVLGIEVKPAPPEVPGDVKAPPAGAKKTTAGVHYRFLGPRKPQGDRPEAASTVRIHYSGWTTDGEMFDSSVTRGRPARFPLGGVIPGFRDGIMQMRVGEKIRMWIPEQLAYKGRPGRPAGMLVFDVELLEVM